MSFVRGHRRALLLCVGVLISAVVLLPSLASSKLPPSAKRTYREMVRRDGARVLIARGPEARVGLRVGREFVRGTTRSEAGTVEFWARPRRLAHPRPAGRIALRWGPTKLTFRTRLRHARWTHVAVGWDQQSVTLSLDGVLVERDAFGAPSGGGVPHVVGLEDGSLADPLRFVALYPDAIEVETAATHYASGRSLFGPLPAKASPSSRVVAHAAAVPGNTVLPAITGTAKDGQTLTSSTGTWSGSPTSYARAWQRCDAAGASCVAISGATGTTYLVASADVGKTIRVKVTATNASGSGNASSAATAVVTAAAPVNTALPAITGTAKDGQTLTSTTGTWSGTATITYARQWRRCDGAGANCVDIAGATATTYVLVAADVGKTVRVVLTASNAAGSASATSAQTAVVTTAAPANTALPAITGTVKEGQSLSASTGTWTGSATITYAYQWQSCNSSGASCVAISGATLAGYRLASTDVGKTVKVVVTATNGAGSASATSAASALVTTGPPVSTIAPTASGTAKDGQVLTTVNGSWAGTATITYARQWKRCDSAGANCTSISGATATTYTLTSTDVGSTVKASWTATNSLGSASADTVVTATVTALAPANTVLPTITGTAKDGQTLTATNGTWTGSATITYTRQWKRCNTAGGSCTNISGATATTYVLTPADVGSTIRTTVTATNAGGAVSADTAATSVVTAQAPVNTVLPAITGTAKDGQTLTSTNGTWTGSSPITYTREWRSCDSAGSNCSTIAGATGTTYTLTATEVGHKIRVVVTATNTAGAVAATSAASATVTANAPANLTVPTITGTAKEGFRVFATTGTWSGSGPLSYTYQWQRCDAAGANCANAPSTTNDYLPYSSDLGKTLRVVVTAHNPAGTAAATSAQSAVVTTSPAVLNTPTDIRLVTTSAPPGALDDTVPILGMDMGQSIASWWGSQPISATYQWQRCDAAGAGCVDITGASGTTYEMASTANIGKTLRVRTTATNTYGSAPTVSSASAVVTLGEPTNLTAPSAMGSARNHYTLTAQPGTWHGPLPTNVVEHFWYRCDSAAANCTKISETPSDDYELVDADVGHRLRVEEHVAYTDDPFSAFSGLGDATQMGPPTDTIVASSTPPAITLGGDLVANPGQWLDGDSYTVTVTATAGTDAAGLANVAVLYDGENIAEYSGCSGASCVVTHTLDIDTSDTDQGIATLWVIATDSDHTQKTEQREIHIDRGAPRAPQHVLVDLLADGSTRLSWQPSNSTDASSYEILRRYAPEDPFTAVGSTEDDFYLDTDTGTGARSAPLARMTAARIGSSTESLSGGEHVEYQVRTIDQAGGTGDASGAVEATATPTPAPAPTDLDVQQASVSAPTQLSWDAAPGAGGYAVYRALDGDEETLQHGDLTEGAAELIADVPATVTDLTDAPEITGRYTYAVRSVSATGQLGDSSPKTTLDLQATKIPPSQELLDHAQEVEGLAEDGGAPPRERVACTEVCQTLRDGERKLPKSGKVADKVADQLYKLRTKVQAVPKLELLGRASLAAEAGIYGWKIGTALRKAYFTEQASAPTPEIHGRKLVHGGDVAATWTCTPDYFNDACIGNGGTSITGQLHAPTLGAVGTGAAGSQILYESWKDDCSTSEAAPEPNATLPGGWGWLTDIGPCPMWWAARDKHWVPFRRVRLSTPVSAPDVPGVDDPTIGTVSPGTEPLTETEALQKLLDELQQHPDQYAALISWLEALLGDTTAPTPDAVPSCQGMTYTTCVSAFEHAGFAGPFTKRTLSPDEAWIGEPGGAVIDTTPWADDQLDDDGPVTITVNPDTMPAWTAEDEEVDQHIEESHDTSTKRNEDLENETRRKNAARQCRIRVTKPGSGRTLSDCWSMPILITGGADAHGPAENDWQAITGQPRWVGLNRRPSPTPRNDEWYLHQPGPADGCLQPKPYEGGECHEFPFWSTQQHWAKQPLDIGPLAVARPYISWTHGSENNRQGQVLQRFYGGSDTNTFRFTGCNIPETANPVAPLSDIERMASPPTFLAIPVKLRLMPSFGICNDGTITP